MYPHMVIASDVWFKLSFTPKPQNPKTPWPIILKIRLQLILIEETRSSSLDDGQVLAVLNYCSLL